MTKPTCSLSLDLDNEWSYLKTHADPGWEDHPSYLDTVIPRVLDMLGERDWRITFFIVGQDAALDKNRDALGMITAAGHEVGNHSYHHEPWIHSYSIDDTDNEIGRAEDSIEAATAARPRGYRGPGYSLSRTTLEVLQRRRYLYDASTLPTFLGPLARAYYFLTSNLTDDERDRRSNLFGGVRDGLRPIRPYRWILTNGDLLEIPVTTMPLFRLPFHFSYLLYLGTLSPSLARLYFATALNLCRRLGCSPSLLLHPLDFLGQDDVTTLSFFPAMKTDSGRKIAQLERLFDVLAARYSITSMGDHARRLESTAELDRIPPHGL
jgi:peptidoglycan/xylan/chitin deacetylase (PgdA/CDA1 family)